MDFLNLLADIVRSPSNWIIVGLASFLGRVWSKRIALKEDGKIKEDLIRLESSLKKESAAVSLAVQHQSDLIKQIAQGASGDKSLFFQKQFEAVLTLWGNYLSIKAECGKFFIYHQILDSSHKTQKSTYAKVPLLQIPAIEESLKKSMAIQAQCLVIQPLIPPSVFALFSGLITFYIRLGVHQMISYPLGIVSPWFIDKDDPDYSVKQLILIAQQIGLKLPELNDDVPGFESWKSAIEERFLADIQKFMNGSLDRHLEVYNELKIVTDINTELKK